MTEPSDAADDRWFSAIPAGLALVLVVLGTMMVAIDRHHVAAARAMRSWPSTTATVTSSGFRDERQQDGRWFQFEDTTFRYSVNGREYKTGTEKYAGLRQYEHYLHYHPNDTVRVYYDPADPASASLTNDPPMPSKVMLLIGALLFALSLPFWYFAARTFWKRPQSRVT